MLKKILATALGILLVHGAACLKPAFAGSKEEKLAAHTDQIRTGIMKLGVGPDARVKLKLRDNKKLAGFISESNHDSFVVTDAKSKANTTVDYRDVSQVKGHNLSTGAKIAIGIGIGVGLTILVLYLLYLGYGGD